MKKIITLACAMAAVLSCSKETKPVQAEFTEGVIATAKDFSCATKTAITGAGSFAWAEGDIIGVVPMDDHTFQTNYEIKTIGSDPKAAAFDGGAWALKEGRQYVAYYPCQSIVLTSEGSATVSFLGQCQAANDNLAHLGKYDYMYAGAATPENGATTFAFEHKVSLVRVTVPVQADATYTNLTLTCEANAFAKDATLSIADGSLTAGTMVASTSIALDDITLSEGENLVVWAVVLPTTEVAGKKFTAMLTDDGGNSTPFKFSTTVSAFEAGKIYALDGQLNTNVIFKDDFQWLAPVIAGYNEGKTADKICADFVNGTYADLTARLNAGNSYSPNLYSTVGVEEFKEALTSKKYTDLNATAKTIYAQGTVENAYIKFCKGNTQTALAVSPFSEDYSCVELSLDWAIHMTGSALDNVHLQFKIDGDGTFKNGEKTSEAIDSEQAAVGDPFWSHVKIKINDVTPNTKIVISSKEAYEGNFTASGQHRFYIDNLRIENAE